MGIRKITAASICSFMLLGAVLIAADQNRRENSHHPKWNVDQSLANCVAIANQEEIVMARFAESKSKNQSVVDFSKMLVSDHQAFLKKLEKFAPEATREGFLDEHNAKAPTQTTSDERKAGAVTVEVNGKQTSVSTEPGHLDFIALHRELAENCIQQSKEAMSKKEGTKFDECFIGTQIVKHAEMKNKLTVFERHASGELRDILTAGRQTTEKHMKQAEEIMKKLTENNSSRQVSDARK